VTSASVLLAAPCTAMHGDMLRFACQEPSWWDRVKYTTGISTLQGGVSGPVGHRAKVRHEEADSASPVSRRSP